MTGHSPLALESIRRFEGTTHNMQFKQKARLLDNARLRPSCSGPSSDSDAPEPQQSKARLGREAGGDALAQQEQRPQRARRHVDGQPAVHYHLERLLGARAARLPASFLPVVVPAGQPRAVRAAGRHCSLSLLQHSMPAGCQ